MLASFQFDKLRTAIPVAVACGLLMYICAFALRLSDSDLLRPATTFNLGGIVEDLNVPGGFLVDPILGTEISVSTFFFLAPMFIILLQAWILLWTPGDVFTRVPITLFLVKIIPAAVLLMVAWRFAPYASARPEGDASSISEFVRFYHSALLGVETAVVTLLPLPASYAALWDGRSAAAATGWRYAGHAARAMALLCCVGGAILVIVNVSPGLTQPTLGVGAIALALVTLLFLIDLAVNTWKSPRIDKGIEGTEMRNFVLALTLAVGAVSLPHMARPLNLAGADLFIREPEDIYVAALLHSYTAGLPHPIQDRSTQDRSTESEPTNSEADLDTSRRRSIIAAARREAWRQFGQGLDLSTWRFPRGTFVDATMPLVRLDRADLVRANLNRARMADASLIMAKLSGATFVEADLRGARILPDPGHADPEVAVVAQNAVEAISPALAPLVVPSCRDIGTARIDLSRAQLQGADLSTADLRCARLGGVVLDKESILSGAKLQCADFSGADLRGVDLINANLSGAKFDNGTKLEGAHLEGVIFHYASLNGVNFSGSRIDEQTDFRSADLNGSDFSNVKLRPNLSKSTESATTDRDKIESKLVKRPLFNKANLANVTFPFDFSNVSIVGANIIGLKVEGVSDPVGQGLMARGAVQLKEWMPLQDICSED